MFVPGMNEVSGVSESLKVGLWVCPDKFRFYPDCGVCGVTFYGKPTKYCPNCGAYMVNYEAAKNHFDEALKEGTENDGSSIHCGIDD